MYDLVVIGGGPAGMSAAITGARKGSSVLLLERGKYPRHKVCGEFVSAESLDLLRNLLAAPYQSLLDDALRISAGRIFLDGRVLHAAVHPSAASIARLDLDEVLYESALIAGVEVRTLTKVQSINSGDSFCISTSAGNFEARSAINASGRWSNLTTSQTVPTEKWLGVKAHFAEFSPAPSVDLYFFEGGYCGVQPVTLRNESANGRVNAAAMVRADVGSSLPEILTLNSELAERSRNWKLLSDPVTTSPLIFRKPEPARDGVLNAGDAATFVDPFVGDGISLALRSGALAAECADAEIYAHQYRQRFGSVFRTSSQLRRLLRLPQQIRKPILSLLTHTPAVTEYFVTRTR
jgi:flavin-dependent dehydrogenase